MLELAPLQVLVVKLEQIDYVGGEHTNLYRHRASLQKITIDYDKRNDFKMALYK